MIIIKNTNTAASQVNCLRYLSNKQLLRFAFVNTDSFLKAKAAVPDMDILNVIRLSIQAKANGIVSAPLATKEVKALGLVPLLGTNAFSFKVNGSWKHKIYTLSHFGPWKASDYPKAKEIAPDAFVAAERAVEAMGARGEGVYIVGGGLVYMLQNGRPPIENIPSINLMLGMLSENTIEQLCNRISANYGGL